MAVGISEITAIGVYVQFWFPEMAQWIPALIAVGLVALANLAAVRLYGEIAISPYSRTAARFASATSPTAINAGIHCAISGNQNCT